MVPKAHLKNVEHQRDQYKAENKKLKEQIDTSQVSRLIAENEQLKEENEKLEREKKDLHLQMNSYFDERLEAIEKYFTLTDHIRLKAEMNPGVSRYIDLVNYIDRLEEKESDTTHHIPHLTNININDNTEEPMKFIKRIAKERADDER